MQTSIHEVVRHAEDNYIHGSVTLGEYVEFDMHNVIETIDAYFNSKHISGSTDSLGREKPFFNIVNAATNIWYRATDLDRKNIKILASKPNQQALAFISNVLLQNWMKKSRFGVFLNEWGRTLAKYGSAVCKFVEKDGELVASVVPWSRLIVDPVDFDSIPTIEKIYMTPEQLRSNKMYDQELVDKLIDTATESRETLDGAKKDNLSGYIEIYEVHGEMPEHWLDDEMEEPEQASDTVYRQQMQVVSFVANKDGDFEDFTLYRGREAKHPYMITHLIKEDGRTLAIGSVESLFDAQWMMNHTVKNMKDTLDLASKLIFQTSDSNYVGRNVLTAIETGDIFIHKVNEPLTQINNSKADIGAFQNYGTMWQNLSQDITATPDAVRGNTLPSGTPYALGSFLGGQANSLFEQMTENKGLHLEDMMREFVIPYNKKKMNNKEEIVALLDDQGIAEIDAMYVPRQAIRNFNRRSLETLAAGGVPSPFNQQQEEQAVQKSLSTLGNKRFFKPSEIGNKTWKEALQDLEEELTVEVTNENTDKQAVLTTLGSVLQTIAGNPGILQDPNARMVFSQILAETGKISPIQLSTAQSAQAAASPPATTTGGTQALVENLPETANKQ